MWPSEVVVPDDFRVPQLVIPLPVWQKMMSYIFNCSIEINGFGFVSWVNDIICVDEVFILDQEVTLVSAETVQESLDRFVDEQRRTTGKQAAMRFQWHSHVRGIARFSLTDNENIRRWPGDWLISLVGNHYGEFACRLDMRRPTRLTIPLQPLISIEMPVELTEQVRGDIKTHVFHVNPNGDRHRGKVLTVEDSDHSYLLCEPEEFDLFEVAVSNDAR
jgi:hypothetical protein